MLSSFVFYKKSPWDKIAARMFKSEAAHDKLCK